jgi:hypothetical protein
MSKKDFEKLFGLKLGQKVRSNGTVSRPEPDMYHAGFEGEIASFVIPNEGEPFVVVVSGRKGTGSRKSHHALISEVEPA